MASVLDPPALGALRRRVAVLPPDASARWGRMNVAAMLEHLCLAGRMALGELPVEDKEKWVFKRFPLKHLILYVLPFPKGAPTASELIAVGDEPFEENRAALDALLARVGNGPATGPGPLHPLFGPLSREEWGVLVHKHVDHHLRQFGA